MSSALGLKTGSLVRQSLAGRCIPRLLTLTNKYSSCPGLARLLTTVQSTAKCSSPRILLRSASTAVAGSSNTKAIQGVDDGFATIMALSSQENMDQATKEALAEMGKVENEKQLAALLDKIGAKPQLKEILLQEYRDYQDRPAIDVNPEFKASLVRIKMLNEVYYGEQRDTKNFPVVPMGEIKPPVQLYIIPQGFFDAFYKKTGVLGPYLFIGGLFATLLSKEILVVDKYFVKEICYLSTVGYLFYKFGPRANVYMDKKSEEIDQKYFLKPLADAKAEIQNAIERCEKAKHTAEAVKYISEAEKEYLELQMEETYRERIEEVYRSVKSRLDYQMEVQSARRRFEQDHMVNWITKSVLGSITPQQEKQNLAECIATLKSMSVAKPAV